MSYFDLLGLLVLEFGDFDESSNIIQAIEAAIQKIPLNSGTAFYYPTLIAYYFKEFVEPHKHIPDPNHLMKRMGIKNPKFFQHKRKLIAYGILPIKTNRERSASLFQLLDQLLPFFPIRSELLPELHDILNRHHLWGSCKPIQVACCAIAIMSEKYRLGYKVYKIAKVGNISQSCMYAKLKRMGLFPNSNDKLIKLIDCSVN